MKGRKEVGYILYMQISLMTRLLTILLEGIEGACVSCLRFLFVRIWRQVELAGGEKREKKTPIFKRRLQGGRFSAQRWQTEGMGCQAWYVENPVGALGRLWRRPDFVFSPFEYGGYLMETDIHPQYPAHIPARDAYCKKTCIWCGPEFKLPPKRSVEPVRVVYGRKRTGGTCQYAPQAAGLGGKSRRTKNIRSSTPRGWARAVFEANKMGSA